MTPAGASQPRREQWVEFEVEYVRREKKRLAIPLDGIASGKPVSRDLGVFLRTLNFHMHRGKDLARGESPRLLSWRLVDEHMMRSAADCSCGWQASDTGVYSDRYDEWIEHAEEANGYTASVAAKRSEEGAT